MPDRKKAKRVLILAPLLASIQKFTFFVYCGWSGMLNWAIYLKHSKSPAY
jgi:hypothetical protein